MTFEKLVDIIIRSSSEPLSCTKENNVYKIQPASLPGNSALPVTKPISLDLKDASIRRAIDQLFKTANLPYTLDSAASGFVTLKSSNLSFEQALQLLLRTATVPLTYTRENGVYRIYPRDASPTPQTEGMPRPVTLDLANAPLRAALMQLFELANVNYSLPPDMQGTVTLKLSNVPFESALETLLRSSPTRLTYRKDEKAYVVEAAPVDPPTRDENTVIVLKHVTAPEMIRLLTPVRPDGIDWLLPVTARNALFVKSVDEDAVLQLRKLIQIFDAAPKELTLRAEVVTVDGQNRRSTLFSTLIVGRSGSTLVATDRTNGTPTTASRIKLTLIPTALESDLEVNSDWDISLPLPGSKGGVVRLEKGLAATTRLSPGQTTLVGGTTRKQHDLKEQILFFLTWEQPKNPGTSRVSL